MAADSDMWLKNTKECTVAFPSTLIFFVAELYESKQYTYNALLHLQGNNCYVNWGTDVLSPVCR